MDKYDPNEWTSSFVRENKDFCFDFLRETSERVLELMKSHDYRASTAGIDRILNGAITMQNAGVGNMNPLLCTLSFSEGVIIVCGFTDAPESSRRKTAIAAFSDAKDFSTGNLGGIASNIVEMLQSGKSLSGIQQEICPNFPDDLIDLMKDTGQRINELRSRSNSSTKSKSSGGCYVATCVYGSYDCPQVWTLRRFRDQILAESWIGRAFIRVYYAVSPFLVKHWGKTSTFQRFWRKRLDRIVSRLHKKGIEETPYTDIN